MNSVTLEFTTYWFSDAMMPTIFGFSNITIPIIYRNRIYILYRNIYSYYL